MGRNSSIGAAHNMLWTSWAQCACSGPIFAARTASESAVDKNPGGLDMKLVWDAQYGLIWKDLWERCKVSQKLVPIFA